jgi:protease-4
MLPLLNEISRGTWAMSPEGLNFWTPLIEKMMRGEKFDITKSTTALLSVIDPNGNRLSPDNNGSFNPPKGSVAVVNIEGALIKYSDYCSAGAIDIVAALQAADDNPNIIGTVAYFNGPGGSVSAISPFVDFSTTKKKPIVGLYDQACSAHLYAMLAVSDYIMAENDLSSVIGSVGIVATLINDTKALEMKGIVVHQVYPDESANKNEAFILALDGKYDMLKKEVLSPMAIKFQDYVKLKRPNLKNENGVLTGNTFSADQALQLKLIDGIGNLQAAIAVVKIKSETNSLYKKQF